MSTIVIIIQKKIEISVLKELHQILGGSLSRINSSIKNSQPIFEMDIFDNSYDSKSLILRKLITLIKNKSLLAEIFELPSGEIYKNSEEENKFLIDIEILSNILNSADDEINRQFNL